MYQLSHLLSEQRSLLVALLENSILGDKAPGLKGVEGKQDPKSKFADPNALNLSDNFQEGRRHLAALLEKVEGCTVSNRDILNFIDYRTYCFVKGCG